MFLFPYRIILNGHTVFTMGMQWLLYPPLLLLDIYLFSYTYV